MGNNESSISVAEEEVNRVVLARCDSSFVTQCESDIDLHDLNASQHPRNRLTLGWYQEKGLIGHTGFVLSINGVKMFTFDLTGKSTGISRKAARGFIFHYKQEYNYKGDLCEMSCDYIPNFIDVCRDFQRKMYHITLANCRDFLTNVATKLLKDKKLPQPKFVDLFEQVQEIKQEDIDKGADWIPKKYND